MASQVPRTKVDKKTLDITPPIKEGETNVLPSTFVLDETTSKLWRSEGHPIDRNLGHRVSGGPFHVTHLGTFMEPGYGRNLCRSLSGGKDVLFTGPLLPNKSIPLTTGVLERFGSNKVAKDWDSSSLNSDGATAISQCAPTNPTTNLGTTLAETMREGLPSLIGIQSWKRRTEAAKAAGSEYLNYQFGWVPLLGEINPVVNTARNHRDIMQNYAHNEGRDVHRRFDFPVETQTFSEQNPNTAYIGTNLPNLSGYANISGSSSGQCMSCYRKVTKRWFEGCFTYGGPAKADNFQRHLSFGDKADQLFGLKLTPDVLWELTPWSWAVDWFSNTGDVINNITQFGTAGLVMRYGFMMTEVIEEAYNEFSGTKLRTRYGSNGVYTYGTSSCGTAKYGQRYVTRSRAAANPFGFGVGWEGLSPTQLAITAALGITRLL